MPKSRSEFERELEALRATVAELFGMVTEDLPKATEALLDGGGDASGELAERERAIDGLYHGVEELASREILLQAPVASDLRFLLSVMRIAPELERSHDLVMQIAFASVAIGGELSPPVREMAGQMGDLASRMWRQAASCWDTRDCSMTSALGERSAELCNLHASLMAELATGKMPVPATMQMTLVARCYERLGAHAVNIARREEAYLVKSTAR